MFEEFLDFVCILLELAFDYGSAALSSSEKSIFCLTFLTECENMNYKLHLHKVVEMNKIIS